MQGTGFPNQAQADVPWHSPSQPPRAVRPLHQGGLGGWQRLDGMGSVQHKHTLPTPIVHHDPTRWHHWQAHSTRAMLGGGKVWAQAVRAEIRTTHELQCPHTSVQGFFLLATANYFEGGHPPLSPPSTSSPRPQALRPPITHLHLNTREGLGGGCAGPPLSLAGSVAAGAGGGGGGGASLLPETGTPALSDEPPASNEIPPATVVCPLVCPPPPPPPALLPPPAPAGADA